MRRLFTTFLTFLVLLPSLACAMPVCSTSEPVESQMPCHDQMDNDQINLDKLMALQDCKLMTLQDCMGVDFQVAENGPNLGLSDKSKNTFDQVAAIVDAYNWSYLASKSRPRAPLLESISLQFVPSIILSTQGFRI